MAPILLDSFHYRLIHFVVYMKTINFMHECFPIHVSFCLLPENYFQQFVALRFMRTGAPERNTKHSEYLRSIKLRQWVWCICFSFYSHNMSDESAKYIDKMCWISEMLLLHFSLPKQRLSCFIKMLILFALQAPKHVSNAHILDFVK